MGGKVTLGADAGVVDNLTWDIYAGFKYNWKLDDQGQHDLGVALSAIFIQLPADAANPYGIIAPVDHSKPPMMFWLNKWFATYTFKYAVDKTQPPKELNELTPAESALMASQAKNAGVTTPEGLRDFVEDFSWKRLKGLSGLGAMMDSLPAESGELAKVTQQVRKQLNLKEGDTLKLSEFLDAFVNSLVPMYGSDPVSGSVGSNYITAFNGVFSELVNKMSGILGEGADEIGESYISSGVGTVPFGKVGMKPGTNEYDLDTPDKVSAAAGECLKQLKYLKLHIPVALVVQPDKLDERIAAATKWKEKVDAFAEFNNFKVMFGNLDARTHVGPDDAMFRAWNWSPAASLANIAHYGIYAMVGGGYAFGEDRPVFAMQGNLGFGTNGYVKWVDGVSEATGLEYKGGVVTGNVILTGLPFKWWRIKLMGFGSADMVGELGNDSAAGMYFGTSFQIGQAKIIPGFQYGRTWPGSLERFGFGINAPVTVYDSPSVGTVVVAPTFDIGRQDVTRAAIGTGNNPCEFGNCNDLWVVNYGSDTGFAGMEFIPKGNFVEGFLRGMYGNIANTGIDVTVLLGVQANSVSTQGFLGNANISPIAMFNLEWGWGF